MKYQQQFGPWIFFDSLKTNVRSRGESSPEARFPTFPIPQEAMEASGGHKTKKEIVRFSGNHTTGESQPSKQLDRLQTPDSQGK